jgi:hypothetical protein
VAALGAVSIGTGVAHYWLSKIVRQARLSSMKAFEAQILEALRSGRDDGALRAQTLLQVLDRVAASPTSTVSNLSRYGSTLSVALIPIFVAELIRKLAS